uniref:Uncharacterized protein n=2 Tax=Timema TaxID=61471 RepID=A0A7R9CU73_TIMPO|nr:unnamed protein product [Timema douglasi]CAD7401562.1 unnamed protein product [Timema poppensis]
MNVSETRKVEAMGMKFVRTILAVTRRDKIWYEVIRKRVWVQGVYEIVEEARLEWYEYEATADDDVEFEDEEEIVEETE